MSENHFLVCADNARNYFLVQDKSRNRNQYHYYLSLETEDYDSTNKVILMKQNFASFLIVHESGIRFYLDDYDIVDMLINMKTEKNKLYSEFCSKFFSFLNGDRFLFKFSMDNIDFEYEGIEYFDSLETLTCKADVEININDFVYLINLILAKELMSREANALENIICKYFTLTEYYSEACPSARKTLKEMGVTVGKSFSESKEWIARAGRSKFVVDFDVFQKYYKI